MAKKSKRSRKRRERARLERIQKEIITEIAEITFPGFNASDIDFDNNIYVKRGKEGKWIDGTPIISYRTIGAVARNSRR